MARRDIENLKKEISIPIAIFDDRQLGVLECLVRYLRENIKLRNTEIAKLLNRDDRTIWTVYHRVKEKTRQ